MIGLNTQLFFNSVKLVFILFVVTQLFFVSIWAYAAFLLLTIIVYFILNALSLPKADSDSVKNIFENFNQETISAGLKSVVAHRACGLDAPENSLSALEVVIKEGFGFVEFDVQLTADGTAVVFHDSSLLRMTNVSENIQTVTFERLQQFSIASEHQFGNKFKGEKIPTLQAFVQLCLKNNIRMFIDLKGDDMKLVPVIVSLFDEYPNLISMAVISSFNPLIIYKIRSVRPKIVGCLAWRSYFYSHGGIDETGPVDLRTKNPVSRFFNHFLNIIHSWCYFHLFHHVLGLSAVLLHKDLITREMREFWKAKNIKLFAWTVNLPTEKAYLDRVLDVPYLTDTVIRR